MNYFCYDLNQGTNNCLKVITSTTRNPTTDEKLRQLKKLPGAYTRIENFVMKFVFITIILLAPLLIYDHFSPVPSKTQAIYCISIIILSLLITFWVTKKFEGGLSNTRQVRDINSTQVEIVKVKTNRAIKRKDPEDFGIAFYIDVTDNGQRKTLYLWGQYLDELEYENQFPNTEFEFVRKVGSDEFIEFRTTGQHFKEEKTLPAFDNEVFEKGLYPVNGQLLDQAIDTIS